MYVWCSKYNIVFLNNNEMMISGACSTMSRDVTFSLLYFPVEIIFFFVKIVVELNIYVVLDVLEYETLFGSARSRLDVGHVPYE